MLKIRFTDGSKPAFWVVEKNFLIGRSKSNHLCIDNPSLDDKHARISCRDDNFILKDLGSSNGTFVNDTQINQKNIGCGDRIRVGQVCIDIIDPFLEFDTSSQWALIADSSWLNGQEFQLNFQASPQDPSNKDSANKAPKNRITLGRSNHCDIVIPGAHLSREHAELKLTDSGLQIRDLNSANGTFVNGMRVEASRLKAGDKLRIDVYSFRVFGPGMQLPRAATRTMPAVQSEKEEQEQPAKARRWKVASTSPGNRTQENLYKRRWLPAASATVILTTFALALIYLLVL